MLAAPPPGVASTLHDDGLIDALNFEQRDRGAVP
jgi:hypothetical protein